MQITENWNKTSKYYTAHPFRGFLLLCESSATAALLPHTDGRDFFALWCVNSHHFLDSAVVSVVRVVSSRCHYH